MFTSLFPCAVPLRYLAVSLAWERSGGPALNIPLSCPSLGRESPPIFSHRHLSTLCLVAQSAGFELQSPRSAWRLSSSWDIQRPDRGSPRWRCRLRVKTVILSTLSPSSLDLHPRLIFLALLSLSRVFWRVSNCFVIVIHFHRVFRNIYNIVCRIS